MSKLSKPMIPVDGAKALEVLKYDSRLIAVLLAGRDDYDQILESIPQVMLRRNIAALVWPLRQALGLDFEYAKGIVQDGRQYGWDNAG